MHSVCSNPDGACADDEYLFTLFSGLLQNIIVPSAPIGKLLVPNLYLEIDRDSRCLRDNGFLSQS